MNIYTLSKIDLDDSSTSSRESKQAEITVPRSPEKIVEILLDRKTERGTTIYLVTLGGEPIGRIYYRKKEFYYAVLPEELGKLGKSFDNLDRAEEWLVDAYYSLEAAPVAIEEYKEIIYVFRGTRSVGECHFSCIYKEWLVYAKPGSVRVYSDRFDTKQKAIDFIVNLSLDPECDLYEYLVHLDGEDGFTSKRVLVDRRTHDWGNWLAHFEKVECKEYKFLAAIAIG